MAEVYFPLRAVRRMRTVTSGITTVLCSPCVPMQMLCGQNWLRQDGIVPGEDVLLPEEESELQAEDDEEATKK